MTETELARLLGGDLYIVGGAVRDRILGKVPSDTDYVLCGTKLEDVPLPKIAGKDFPVFLTEVEGRVCEIAMARSERKVGQGYHGFEFHTNPSLTIQEDLIRRDLTINAMAIHVATGEMVDPYGGRADLEKKVLRHTSDAFAEDPLRVYRVARFAARFGFRIAPETKELMLGLKHELRTLTPERVYMEFEKALVSRHPDLFFRALDGLLDVHFPEIEALKVPDKHDGTAFEHTMIAVRKGHGLMERFGLLVHDLGKGTSPEPPVHHGHHDKEHLVDALGDRLRIPKKMVAFGRKTMKLHMKVKELHLMRTGKLLRLADKSLFTQLKLSYLESDGRYEKRLYMEHVRLIKKALRIKAQVTGDILIRRGIQPDALFGQKLLNERIKAFRKEKT